MPVYGVKEEMMGRMYMVLALLLLFPVTIAGKVVFLYLQEGRQLREHVARQVLARQSIPALRGNIYDREGRLLVVNTARFDLALDPMRPEFREIRPAFIRTLARLTGRPEAYYERKIRNRVSQRYVVLLRHLTEEQKEAIEEAAEEWKAQLGRPYATLQTLGILLEPHFGRKYTYGTTGAHVLGYVNRDMEGLAGLELQYNARLRGTPGERQVQRDRMGRIKAMVGGEEVPPRHGEQLVLTLDLVRQAMVEEELARGVREMEARWGTAVAIDPRTGAILAMANVPGFHPERAAAYPPAARRNHAITDRIEPGSTFKLVTAVAALDQGLAQLEDSIDTGNGWAVFSGRTMRDVHAHGRITLAEAIIYSSNVGIAQTAMRMEPGILYQYARNFGFGQPTWIDLPGEVEGSLKKPAEWSRTTQAWMSIGYEVEVTPLQLLLAYAALANGGLLMQPYVVAERRSMNGEVVWRARPDSIRRVFRRETARKLIPVFEQVVERGTGRKARIPGIRIAGKTGTAQKVVDGRYQRGAYRASFVGFFPVEHPQVVLLVVVDEPKKKFYGGDVAAPIFRRIAERWIGISPEIYEPLHEQAPGLPLLRPVPEVQGLPAVVAATRLEGWGFDVRPTEARDRLLLVEAQQPVPGDSLPVGAPVTLRLSEEPFVPDRTFEDLEGWPLREALTYLAAQGISARAEGQGLVRQVRLSRRENTTQIILRAR